MLVRFGISSKQTVKFASSQRQDRERDARPGNGGKAELGYRWRQMLESGEYACSAELAKAEKVNASYLSRILRLTLIAPDIIEAMLTGRQPSTLQLDDLLKPLPAPWARQHAELFGSP
jgi:hypothetical protein